MSWPAFFWITFHFKSSVCFCVGYKTKTCTQISDSGFRGKINAVSPGDSAEREIQPHLKIATPCYRLLFVWLWLTSQPNTLRMTANVRRDRFCRLSCFHVYTCLGELFFKYCTQYIFSQWNHYRMLENTFLCEYFSMGEKRWSLLFEYLLYSSLLANCICAASVTVLANCFNTISILYSTNHYWTTLCHFGNVIKRTSKQSFCLPEIWPKSLYMLTYKAKDVLPTLTFER